MIYLGLAFLHAIRAVFPFWLLILKCLFFLFHGIFTCFNGDFPLIELVLTFVIDELLGLRNSFIGRRCIIFHINVL